MKSIIFLLLLFCALTSGAGMARAVDLQTTAIAEVAPSSAVPDKKPVAIGPRDPEKKPHGVGVNVFLNKNVAVSGSVSLLSPEQSVLSGQPEQTGQTGVTGGLGLRASQVGGTVGFKLFF